MSEALRAAAARLLGRAIEAARGGERGLAIESLPGQLSEAEALDLLHGWRTARRLALIGDGCLFLGAGVAIDHGAVTASQAATILAMQTERDPARRYALALPFSSTPHDGDASWRRLRRTSLWSPRVFLRRADPEPLSLGVDLGGHTDTKTVIDQLRALLAGVGAEQRQASRVIAPPSPTSWQQQPDRAQHLRAVERAVATMHDGALSKIVLGRRARGLLGGLARPGDRADLASALLARIETSSRRETKWLVGEGDDVVVGCTPERLVRRRGAEVSIDVLAGTARLGVDAILSCDKERREHEAVRRFVIEALQPEGARIEAPTEPTLRRLRFIQHLWTPVTARLPASRPVFHRLHPTPAVAGVPTSRAARLIDELEGFDRGLYAGAIGVACADTEDVWVGLRCAHLHGDRAGHGVIDVYAGGGLVLGSDPEAEWRELDDKARTILGALEGLGGRQREARGAA